jgi:hypothetical protein
MPKPLERFFFEFPVPVGVNSQLSRLTGVIGIALGGLLALAGCVAPPAPEGPTSVILHIPDRDAFLDETIALLRLYDFPPDTFDRERGRIVTRPATSAQWFEFWRVDARGGYNFLESSLHTMRRIVTIEFDALPPDEVASSLPSDAQPAAPPHPYRVTVTVRKERLSQPERQVTTTSGALGIYHPRVPTAAGLRGERVARVQWVPLGRDPLLEEYFVRRLLELEPPYMAVQ